MCGFLRGKPHAVRWPTKIHRKSRFGLHQLRNCLSRLKLTLVSSVAIIWIRHIWGRAMTPEVEWKKVSAELLILSLVEARPRHGYEISKLIEQRSGGAVRFYVASLYPLLYRLEKRGWIQGRWVEKSGQRRRRYYRLTSEGQKVLASQRRGWQAFVEAVNRITEAEHA
jgi:PadR family transcriptional regulator, regulatory protein PadR